MLEASLLSTDCYLDHLAPIDCVAGGIGVVRSFYSSLIQRLDAGADVFERLTNHILSILFSRVKGRCSERG
jgi:hypothetical protein